MHQEHNRSIARTAAFGIALASTAMLGRGEATPLPSIGNPNLGVSSQVKNYILLIPDGTGPQHQSVARWVKGAPLAIDATKVAMVRSFMSNSLIGDSAPTATAMASGYTTKDKFIGVMPGNYELTPLKNRFPSGMEHRPVASILEAARFVGKSTGVVSTSHTVHATPAAFTSHWNSRTNDQVLQKQQAYANCDIVLGGGYQNLVPKTDTLSFNGKKTPGTRLDGENIIDTLKSRGYQFVTTKAELDTAKSARIWGHFAPNGMAHDIDRSMSKYAEEPSIEDMTRKAIEVLDKNPKGFFLMVEGSEIDWASHGNDPVGVATDYLAFDKAVKAALDYAKAKGNTLVMVATDHDNGGMSTIGVNANYTAYTLEDLINPIKNATVTAVGAEELIRAGADISSTLTGKLGKATAPTPDEIAKIAAEIAKPSGAYVESVIGHIISDPIGIAWTTNGHTGGEVPLYYYGISEDIGTILQCDMGWIASKAMNLDLTRINDSLFVELSELFPAPAAITLDTAGIEIGKGRATVIANGKALVFPFNEDAMTVDGERKPLGGLIVYSKGNNKVYAPKRAAEVEYTTPLPKGALKRKVGFRGGSLILEKGSELNFLKIDGSVAARLTNTSEKVELRGIGLDNGTFLVQVNGAYIGKLSHGNNTFAWSER